MLQSKKILGLCTKLKFESGKMGWQDLLSQLANIKIL